MIPFHIATCELNDFKKNLIKDLNDEQIRKFVAEKLKCNNFFFTKSCTQSLEIAFLTLDLPFGSEVIIPSYSFVSLANAVNNIGLKCVFVDCEEHTMNINVDSIEESITSKTKAILSINYGGISCDYDRILDLCKKHKLYLIEDNAHGILGKYKKMTLGSIGDIACFSFDHLKNFSCFQGGGISINNKSLLNKYHISSDFGTNRKACLTGKVDFYEWVGKGTNTILANPLQNLIFNQIKDTSLIINKFNLIWNRYYNNLKPLEEAGCISLTKIPYYAKHNAHMFWIFTNSELEKDSLIKFLKENNIQSASHYVPLHNSYFGKQNGLNSKKLNNTEILSKLIVRLPMYYSIQNEEIDKVSKKLFQFFKL